jgi:PhzF family phenazine biosynthesis protein
MSPHPFTQVDVFTDTPLRGNPLAVVHAADALSDTQMQSFARWTNLSETTFLLRPGTAEADYRVRIFTPGGELPFAGHPTLGTCHAWLQAGGVPRHPGKVVQECGVGLVQLRRGDGGTLAFAAPPMRQDAVDDTLLQAVVAALGLQRHQVRQARWLDNGPRWLALLLEDAGTVLSLEPDHAALARHSAKVGVVGPCGPGAASQFELRAFAAPIGIPEDPVTGSLNASVAQWLMDQGLAPERYTASQGARLNRAGRVELQRKGGTLWVGGHSVTCIRGELTL